MLNGTCKFMKVRNLKRVNIYLFVSDAPETVLACNAFWLQKVFVLKSHLVSEKTQQYLKCFLKIRFTLRVTWNSSSMSRCAGCVSRVTPRSDMSSGIRNRRSNAANFCFRLRCWNTFHYVTRQLLWELSTRVIGVNRQ